MSSEQRETRVTAKEMADALVPVHARDYCAHLLIPLNACRRQTYYLPWKCVDLRHAYEKCEYEEYQRRMITAINKKSEH